MRCERVAIPSLLLVGGCYTATPGVELTVDVQLSEDGVLREGGQLKVITTHGAELWIAHGWIAVTHAVLQPCPASQQARSWLDRVLPTAWAMPPVQVGDALDAVVVPLDARLPGVRRLGVLRPSPTTWCSVTVAYGPVGSLDDTALPDGTWTLDVGPRGAPVHLHGAGQHEATAPLDPPLTLDGQHRTASLTVSLPLAAWLDDVAPADDEPTMSAAVEARLGAAPGATVP